MYLSEFNAFRLFLKEKVQASSPQSKVIRVASTTHVAGNIMLGSYILDGVLILRHSDGSQTWYACQYNDSFTHGCTDTCSFKTHVNIQNRNQSDTMMQNLKKIASIIKQEVNDYRGSQSFRFKVIELSNCKYHNHKIPLDPEVTLLQQNDAIPKKMSHQTLISKILNRDLRGFLGMYYKNHIAIQFFTY